jgi:hypothetical protein
MSTKTPFKNLYVTGIFNLVGNGTITGNLNVKGNLILGNTRISEQTYNELVFLVNQPLLAGPKGEDGLQGPEGPRGQLIITENNDIIESNTGTGSKGDVTFGLDNGNYYLYVCYRSGNWGRIPLDINFSSTN